MPHVPAAPGPAPSPVLLTPRAAVPRSLPQRLVYRLLPGALARKVHQESDGWVIFCPGCGRGRSVWAAGGVRFLAGSSGKATWSKCGRCGWQGLARITWHPEGRTRHPLDDRLDTEPVVERGEAV